MQSAINGRRLTQKLGTDCGITLSPVVKHMIRAFLMWAVYHKVFHVDTKQLFYMVK